MPISRGAAASAGAVTAAAGLALVMLTTASARPAAVARAAVADTLRATLVAQLAAPEAAIDASPDPTGRVIYFTAAGRTGPGIFRVPAAGGAHQPVFVGVPLRGASELAVSNDARQLFVADHAAGRIFVVAVAGGTPHVLEGTTGTAPRGLELQDRAGGEYLIYTGKDPRNGRPAVLGISVRGAVRPTILLEGAVLHNPDGIAVSKSGAIYVSDQAGSRGRVLRIDAGRVTTVKAGLTLGRPAGIALTLDQSKLLVSSVNPATRRAQVLIIDTRSGRTTTFDSVIGANRNPGGLHRARHAQSMAWADVSRAGRVYRIDF